MRVIIAGSREFNDFEVLRKNCDEILSNYNVVAVLCGECRGADLLGKKYAEMRGYPVESFPADWKKHGCAAGPIRNKQMADRADLLIAFWDGKSRGTAGMINLMRNKKVFIVSV